MAIPLQREPVNIMQPEGGVAIFWDFETAKIGGKRSGYQIARNLGSIADQFGIVKSFRTYLDVMNQSDADFLSTRKQLHSSGVTMVDCPSHSGRDIADKVMIVDMLSFILDQPPPYTLVVATSDNDLCFTLAVLRRRRYKVILVCPLQRDCENLAMQADETQRVDWIGASGNVDNLSSPSSPSSSPSSSSILSYADFDTRHTVQNSITGIHGQETGATTEQSKKPNSFHIPSLEHAGNGIDTGSQPDKKPGPGDSVHDVQDIEQPRLRSRTSPGTFFPPAPIFPLETHPKFNFRIVTMDKSAAGRKSPSPQSMEDFSVVDHPRDSLPNLTSHSPPISTPLAAVHLPSANTELPATISSEFPEVPSHPAVVPAAAERTANHLTPALVTPTTNAALATTHAPAPAATPPATATPAKKPPPAPLQLLTTVSAPTLTSTTPRTKEAPKPATSGSLPEKYRMLVKLLQVYHRGNNPWQKGTKIAEALVRGNSQFYKSVGAKKWKQYYTQAMADGIIVANLEGEISLKDKWLNVTV
ncbi:hypothetical protein AGABI2DRAFT_190726 [Agaricus bisporus var. bisporus H97]|uniref:hypothetical protein n=1 Tax=Agaricus bisporus var. bisporus (strain H97 / ATCC MYA-4626 / FGSC 10389) TaxID=936046 RepID=UPI00029F61D2|nr:hypothetical protein AGABI2DRAFT_190726 [Agaricus bisporus var. bisporus H97]EKV50404.1 hypothetical protein AGABI2DRAFT_190726 [Agaricus bisporus var. bisporus H97]